MARKVRDLKQTENGVQLRNEAADVRLIEQILDPLLESMLGIRFRKKKDENGSLGVLRPTTAYCRISVVIKPNF